MPYMQEVKTAIGFHRQSALQTSLAAASMIGLGQTNEESMLPSMKYESNAGDMGKGTPFATQIFPLSASSGGPFAARLSSVNAALAGVFGIGLATKAAAGSGFKYTSAVGTTFAELEADMPTTTFVQACRQGPNAVFDFGLIGMALEDFNLSLKSGIDRNTATISTTWIGCGKWSNPSGITVPEAYAEKALNIGGAVAITMLGETYASNLRFISGEFGWKNNIPVERNYRPGSGLQNGFNVMGRMRRGIPKATMKMVVEVVDGSTEWEAFLAQTVGTVVWTIEGPEISSGVKHKLSLTLHRVQMVSHQWASNDGLIVAEIECDVQLHATNGILTWEVTTDLDEIGELAA
jgi:hypothetical protein